MNKFILLVMSIINCLVYTIIAVFCIFQAVKIPPGLYHYLSWYEDGAVPLEVSGHIEDIESTMCRRGPCSYYIVFKPTNGEVVKFTMDDRELNRSYLRRVMSFPYSKDAFLAKYTFNTGGVGEGSLFYFSFRDNVLVDREKHVKSPRNAISLSLVFMSFFSLFSLGSLFLLFREFRGLKSQVHCAGFSEGEQVL